MRWCDWFATVAQLWHLSSHNLSLWFALQELVTTLSQHSKYCWYTYVCLWAMTPCHLFLSVIVALLTVSAVCLPRVLLLLRHVRLLLFPAVVCEACSACSQRSGPSCRGVHRALLRCRIGIAGQLGSSLFGAMAGVFCTWFALLNTMLRVRVSYHINQ